MRCVVTGHTPGPEPIWYGNVLGADTGTRIDDQGYGRFTITQIDGKEAEASSSDR